MHILTKIFIVLVSLLTAAIVPLVVVHTHNEDSFKAKWEASEAKATVAQSALDTEKRSRAAAETSLQLEQEALKSQISELQKTRDALQARATQLDSELVASRARETSIQADLKVLAESHKANTALTESLVNETRQLRSELLDSTTKLVELDETLRDVRVQLDVADAARRALQIEVQRLKDSNAVTLKDLERYITKYGDLGENEVLAGAIDRDFDALVTNVQRSKDRVLAEVNVGSRDGVQVGWELILHDNGQFHGKLRIVEVDLNRSTGEVLLEQSTHQVSIGDTAIARKSF